MDSAAAPGVEVAAASWPRGNGKSWTGARLLARSLTPGDELFVPRAENLLVSGSIEQARVVFRFVREMLGEKDYRYLDSFTRIGITHSQGEPHSSTCFELGFEEGIGYRRRSPGRR